MGLWAEYFVRVLLMAVFLCGSAYCSATETAFFSLSKRQAKKLRDSKQRLGHLVADLLLKPSNLLGALLLGNLIVNTLFFATSSVLMLKVEGHLGVGVAASVAVVTFLCLVLFGEILPKSLAYANPERFSMWVAVPTLVLVRLLTPGVLVFRWFIAEPALRLLLGPGDRHRTVTSDEFKALIEATHAKGLISDQQQRLFTEVVSFNLLRVRHVMRPRVDMVACDLNEDSVRARKLMIDRCVTMLFIYEDQIDRIVGAVDLRDLVMAPEAPLTDFLHPVQFIPEQMTVEMLLQFFRKRRTDVAVVVDEYGGVAGSVAVEHVAEELFGSLQVNKPREPIEPLGTGRYRVSGSLPIHDWIKAFGLRPAHTGVATVGGWVTALLGRIPRNNDVAHWRHATFTVERMQKHRVASVILSLEEAHG
jgi:putative hemolysin